MVATRSSTESPSIPETAPEWAVDDLRALNKIIANQEKMLANQEKLLADIDKKQKNTEAQVTSIESKIEAHQETIDETSETLQHLQEEVNQSKAETVGCIEKFNSVTQNLMESTVRTKVKAEKDIEELHLRVDKTRSDFSKKIATIQAFIRGRNQQSQFHHQRNSAAKIQCFLREYSHKQQNRFIIQHTSAAIIQQFFQRCQRQQQRRHSAERQRFDDIFSALETSLQHLNNDFVALQPGVDEHKTLSTKDSLFPRHGSDPTSAMTQSKTMTLWPRSRPVPHSLADPSDDVATTMGADDDDELTAKSWPRHGPDPTTTRRRGQLCDLWTCASGNTEENEAWLYIHDFEKET